jgi:hypothetical protein
VLCAPDGLCMCVSLVNDVSSRISGTNRLLFCYSIHKSLYDVPLIELPRSLLCIVLFAFGVGQALIIFDVTHACIPTKNVRRHSLRCD